jgi:hypothetical protein
MAAEIVGGPLGHALEDLAAAYFIGRSVAARILGGIKGAVTSAASSTANSARAAWGGSEAGMQNYAAQVAAEARARGGSSQSTTALNPFNGQPPGYNLRSPAGPALPPGSGNGGAALEYFPGRPGAKTRAEVIDITKLQNK